MKPSHQKMLIKAETLIHRLVLAALLSIAILTVLHLAFGVGTNLLGYLTQAVCWYAVAQFLILLIRIVGLSSHP